MEAVIGIVVKNLSSQPLCFTGLLLSYCFSTLTLLDFIFTLSSFQKLGKRVSMCRTIAREVVGLESVRTPYSRMIKTGGSSADKRIYKFARTISEVTSEPWPSVKISNVNSAQRAPMPPVLNQQ
jgi:hypothetical protein